MRARAAQNKHGALLPAGSHARTSTSLWACVCVSGLGGQQRAGVECVCARARVHERACMCVCAVKDNTERVADVCRGGVRARACASRAQKGRPRERAQRRRWWWRAAGAPPRPGNPPSTPCVKGRARGGGGERSGARGRSAGGGLKRVCVWVGQGIWRYRRELCRCRCRGGGCKARHSKLKQKKEKKKRKAQLLSLGL